MSRTLAYPQLEAAGNAPDDIVRNILTALNKRDIVGATSRFSNRFTFEDHALGFTFTEKEDFDDFLQKAAQILQESSFEIGPTMMCGDQALVEWTLKGIKNHDLGAAFGRRTRVSVKGVSVVRVTNGEVVSWEDYYDASKSWRFSLAGLNADHELRTSPRAHATIRDGIKPERVAQVAKLGMKEPFMKRDVHSGNILDSCQYTLTINGRSAKTSSSFDVHNPADGELVAACPEGSPTLMDEAILCARQAFPQ